MKYIYGPVASWRFGRSLGVDLLSQRDKVCTFDCVYCQLGEGSVYCRRKVYVQTDEVLAEIEKTDCEIDQITLSGMGEPTIAENLGEVIRGIMGMRKEPVGVLTNSSLLTDGDVISDLIYADLVSLKLDAVSEESFLRINRPKRGFSFSQLLEGIKSFRKAFSGRFILQIMFFSQNKDFSKELSELSKEVEPDEVHINTPTRPCPVSPLSCSDIAEIRERFSGQNVKAVYESEPPKVLPIDVRETLRRRGE
jgi:wyosine [tRNA(Phe)-imidazoG37] synthetase (radical SAM superfamily)